MFVYDGLSLNSVAVAGNHYLNFILVCLIEVPASLAACVLMERAGRRASMCSSLILAGLACIVFHFLPAGEWRRLGLGVVVCCRVLECMALLVLDVPWIRVTVFLLGKFGITISYTVIYVLTAELFPTKVRHSLFAVCSTIGRVGSILAPQTPLLARYLDSLPLIMFGSMSLLRYAYANTNLGFRNVCVQWTVLYRAPLCQVSVYPAKINRFYALSVACCLSGSRRRTT